MPTGHHNPVFDNPVFDRLWAAAVPEIVAGRHRRDEPPVDGGRWPVTVVCRPPNEVRVLLEQWMHEAMALAGPGHFQTGRRESVHLTIRALEPYREAASASDPIVDAWREAMVRTADATPTIDLSVTGVTLSTAGVLAQVEPSDERAWELMDRLRVELGSEAWFEDQWMKRDIWYSTLLHFADDIADPQALVEWAASRRQVDRVPFTVESIELVRSRHTLLPPRRTGETEHYLLPESWFTLPLRG